TDTLQLFLADETGDRTGSGSGGLYQCTLPYKMTFPILQEGQSRTIRVVQIMKDRPLKGISNVGIQIKRK
ncbi:MAG: gliding motility lipoprotein GldH, partial [Bacteroidales bacterium]|nr:gliding motility lipoprotein GldH [Bacteroidales bacterium]